MYERVTACITYNTLTQFQAGADRTFLFITLMSGMNSYKSIRKHYSANKKACSQQRQYSDMFKNPLICHLYFLLPDVFLFSTVFTKSVKNSSHRIKLKTMLFKKMFFYLLEFLTMQMNEYTASVTSAVEARIFI